MSNPTAAWCTGLRRHRLGVARGQVRVRADLHGGYVMRSRWPGLGTTTAWVHGDDAGAGLLGRRRQWSGTVKRVMQV
ncbi:hypothetical protein M0R45_020264 [Rubus argutus]|uniref:MHC class I antigen n=1 Tax=Rubus argutus TaxID=59490 RepID=A0AAW1X9W4_RUBAR